MIIVNKTNNIIYVNGNILQAGNWIDIKQHVFDTINILSDIGSAEIICEYYSRFIKNFGSIIAQKSDSEGDEIIIMEKTLYRG